MTPSPDNDELKRQLVDMSVKAATLDSLIKIMGIQGLIPSHFNDVKAFNEKFGLMIGRQPQHLTRRKLKERVEFMLEELEEFADAAGLLLSVQTYHDENSVPFTKLGVESNGKDDQDLPEQADALVDLVYVALGTAVMMGLPWAELWDDVQRANMAKVRGATKRGHRVDCMKPEGWRGPMGAAILDKVGYRREHYTGSGWDDAGSTVDEAKCHDDV